MLKKNNPGALFGLKGVKRGGVREKLREKERVKR